MSSQYITYHTGDGTTVSFSFVFPVISSRDLFVTVNGAEEGSWALGNDNASIIFLNPPASGAVIQIVRYTQSIKYVSFEPTAILTEFTLSLSQEQSLHIAEEANDLALAEILFNGALDAYDAKGHAIDNVGAGADDEDVVTLAQATAAVTAALADGAIVAPSSGDISTADTSAAALWASAQTDAAAEQTSRAGVNADIASMAASLATLAGYVADPPPDGATIVSRIDTYTGGTTWRTPGTVPPNANTDWTTPGSHTWTKPDSGTIALIETWGGGAAGASATSNDPYYGFPLSAIVACPGGAGGGYNRKWVLLSDLGATETVTVGDGGTPSYAVVDTGRDGLASSFGSWCSASGGRSSQSPYSGGGGGGPLGASSAYRYASGANTGQSLGGLPTWLYTIWNGVGPVSADQYGNITYSAAAFTESPGDGAYFPADAAFVYGNGLPSGGLYHGGGGGHLKSPDGANSVNGGAGGGCGYTVPASPGASLAINLPRTGYPTNPIPATGRFTNPSAFPNGNGGVSTNGGNGGAGGGPNQNGFDGATPGGGGGGAGAGPLANNNPSGPLGGHGGAGRVRITVFG